MSDNKRLGKHFENLSDDAKIYIESEIEYHKLDLYKKLINSISYLLKFLVNSSILLLAFSFLFTGISLFIGYLLGYYFLGFLIMAAVLFIITMLMIAYGKPIFEKRVLRMFNSIFGDLKK